MVSWLRIIGWTLLGLIVTVWLALFVVPKTGWGQHLIDKHSRPAVERAVRSALGSDIDYATPQGNLPSHLRLHDIVLSEDGVAWATVEAIRVDWSPLALLHGKVEVAKIHVAGAVLHHRPPARPDALQEQTPKDDTGGLPHLPAMRFGEVTIDGLSIRETVFGNPYDLTATLSGAAKGHTMDAVARIDSQDGSDFANIRVLYNGDRLTLGTDVLSRPGGLLATLSQAEGAVWLTLNGDGPLDAWGGQIEAELGHFGAMGGTLIGDLATGTAAKLVARLAPGPALPDIVPQLTGEVLDVHVRTSRNADQLVVSVDEIRGRFGHVTGDIGVKMAGFDQITTDLSGTLSGPAATDLGAGFAAGEFALTGTAARTQTGWALDGTLDSTAGQLAVSDAVTDAAAPFSGQVEFTTTAPLPMLPDLLMEGAVQGTHLGAHIRYEANGLLKLSALDATIGAPGPGRLAAQGEASFHTETGTLTADLGLTAGPSLIGATTGLDVLAGATSGTVRASGTLADLDVTATVITPPGMVDNTPFAAGQIDLTFSGSAQTPTLRAVLGAIDDSFQGTVDLTGQEDTLTLETLSFKSASLEIAGTGQIDRQTNDGSMSLTLAADRPTPLLTGQNISGQAALDLRARDGGTTLAGTLTATDLTVDGTQLGRLEAKLTGPTDQLAYTLNAANIEVGDQYLATVAATGAADIATDVRTVDLTTLSIAMGADEEDETITLVAPTRLTLGEQMRLSQTVLDWRGDGQVRAQGSFGQTRWLGEANLDNIRLSDTLPLLNGTLTIDTNQPQMAAFSARLLTEGTSDVPQPYALNATGQWDGEAIGLDLTVGEANSSAPVVTGMLRTPLGLDRSGDGLALAPPTPARPGTLAGSLTMNGPMEALTVFGPDLPLIMEGMVNATIDVTGTPIAPQAAGTLTLTDGMMEDEALGLALRQMAAQATFAYAQGAHRADITLTGTDVAGREKALSLTGQLDAKGDTSTVTGQLILDQATLADSPDLAVKTSADLTLSGSLADLMLTGQATIDRLDAQIPASTTQTATANFTPVTVVRVDNGTPVASAPPAAAPEESRVALDVRIKADREVFVRGRGLDSEWATNLHVQGTAASPAVTGTINSRAGTFQFAGRTFTITEGRMTFDEADLTAPQINLTAEYATDTITALVTVTGEASDPAITLSSTPERPQEDVMSLLLFGKQPTQLSALESLQIANAIRQITQGDSLNVGNDVRAAIGLDALSVGIDPETGQAVAEAGKYLTDEIYLSAKQSAAEPGTEVTVVYELSDKVTIESTLKPNGAQNVAANYKKDY